MIHGAVGERIARALRAENLLPSATDTAAPTKETRNV
jgi:hypothetical protein